jgi:hypothetical protein
MAQKLTVWERRMENVSRRKERELNASVWPNDKLRVVPTHYQAVVHGSQVLQFRPTEVIDDPYRIKLMDELDVEYRVVSPPPRKAFPVAMPPAKTTTALPTTNTGDEEQSTTGDAVAQTDE